MASLLQRRKTKKVVKIQPDDDDENSDDNTNTVSDSIAGGSNSQPSTPDTPVRAKSRKVRPFIAASTTPLSVAWGKKTRLSIAAVFEQGVRDAMEDAGVVLVGNGKRVQGPSVVTVSPHVRLINTVTKSSKRILAIFGVFDGHGGPETSARLRLRLADAVLAALEALSSPQFRDSAVVDRTIETVFADFDQQYCDEIMKVSQPPTQTSGSTAILVIVLAKSLELIVCNVGDCRAILCRGRKTVSLSRDHLPILADEKRRVLASKGGVIRDDLVGGVLQMTRAFGDYELKNIDALTTDSPVIATPEIRRVQLDESDSYIVVACDGLWDVYTNREVVEVIDSAITSGVVDCEGICHELVHTALACGSTDNTSAILCHITRDEIAEDDFEDDQSDENPNDIERVA